MGQFRFPYGNIKPSKIPLRIPQWTAARCWLMKIELVKAWANLVHYITESMTKRLTDLQTPGAAIAYTYTHMQKHTHRHTHALAIKNDAYLDFNDCAAVALTAAAKLISTACVCVCVYCILLCVFSQAQTMTMCSGCLSVWLTHWLTGQACGCGCCVCKDLFVIVLTFYTFT